MPVTMKVSVPSPTKILAAPTSSTPYLTGTKSPPPNRCTPHHLDDPQSDAERIPQFKELQEYEMKLTASKTDLDKERRKEENAQWLARQEARRVAEKAEKDRAKALRKDALEKMRWEAEGFQTKEPGYGPQRWTYTVASKHPRMWATAHDVLLPASHPAGYDLSTEPFVAYAAGIQAHEEDMKLRGVQRRVEDDQIIQAVADRKKLEREAAAKAQQQAIVAKQAAVEKAVTSRSRVIKKEMAEEARKQKAMEEKKEAERWKESMQQRQANMAYAKDHGHWDWGIKRQPDLALLQSAATSPGAADKPPE